MKRLLAAALLVLGLGVASTQVVGRTMAAFSAQVANTSTFSAAAVFPTACRQYTPVWMTGIEHGMDTSAGGGVWSAGISSGTATIDTAVKRSGSSSLRLDAAGGLNVYRGRILPLGATSLVMSFGLRFETLPAADVVGLGGMTVPNSGTHFAFRYVAATKQLAIGFTGQTVPGTVTLAPGTWYTIDVKVDVGTATHSAAWQIDGVAQPGTTFASPATTAYAAGWGTATSDTFSAHYDDMVISTTAADYPIGRTRILSVRPNGMGTNVGATNFVDDDGTAVDAMSWARLAEPVAGDAAGHVRQTVASGTSYIEMTMEDTTQTCVRAAHAVMVFDPLDVNQANHGRAEVLTGTTSTVVFDGQMTARSVLMLPKAVTVTPPAGGWTPAALNDLRFRFGYSTDVAPQPRWISLLAEYDAG